MGAAGPASSYNNIKIYCVFAGGAASPFRLVSEDNAATARRLRQNIHRPGRLDAEESIFIVNQCQSILSLDVK